MKDFYTILILEVLNVVLSELFEKIKQILILTLEQCH